MGTIVWILGSQGGPLLAACPQAPPPLSAGDPFPGARGAGVCLGGCAFMSSLRCDPGPTSALSLRVNAPMTHFPRRGLFTCVTWPGGRRPPPLYPTSLPPSSPPWAHGSFKDPQAGKGGFEYTVPSGRNAVPSISTQRSLWFSGRPCLWISPEVRLQPQLSGSPSQSETVLLVGSPPVHPPTPLDRELKRRMVPHSQPCAHTHGPVHTHSPVYAHGPVHTHTATCTGTQPRAHAHGPGPAHRSCSSHSLTERTPFSRARCCLEPLARMCPW